MKRIHFLGSKSFPHEQQRSLRDGRAFFRWNELCNSAGVLLQGGYYGEEERFASRWVLWRGGAREKGRRHLSQVGCWLGAGMLNRVTRPVWEALSDQEQVFLPNLNLPFSSADLQIGQTSKIAYSALAVYKGREPFVVLLLLFKTFNLVFLSFQ